VAAEKEGARGEGVNRTVEIARGEGRGAWRFRRGREKAKEVAGSVVAREKE